MWRMIVLAIALVILYFMVKSAVRSFFGKGRNIAKIPPGGPASELVQDPVCGMFITKEGALFVRHDGQTQFFCSDVCRASYQKKFTPA
jgi:YHS domain-containing protein